MGLLASAFVLLAAFAHADPASELSEAESRAAGAAAEVAAAEQRLDAARADFAAASRRAGPAAKSARAARVAVRDLKVDLLERQRRARAELAELEATHRQEEDEHDDEVTTAAGFGVAALIAAAIALAWGWFRASAAVAALVGMQLVQAVAICLGGGFLLLVLGAALNEGDGFIGALGTAMLCLGFILPAAFLLGRHSAEIQRGRAKPMFGRERLPRRVSQVAAALLLLIGIGALGDALFAEGPSEPSISAQQREEAEPLRNGPGAAELEEAEAKAIATRERAAGPIARQRAAAAELRRAIQDLRGAERRLVAAEADERRHERRLAVVVAREEREAEEQAELEAEAVQEEAEEQEEAAGCDPNYSGCVPAYPPDVNCAEVGGSVSVYGADPHGLDADGDGVGCE